MGHSILERKEKKKLKVKENNGLLLRGIKTNTRLTRAS